MVRMNPARSATIAGLVLLAGAGPPPGRAGGAGPGPTTGRVEFCEREVRPLLADRCYKCHSSGAERVRGHLRLDTRAGLLQGGDLGPAVVPGAPDRSPLIRAVRYDDPDLKMPPD